MTRKVTFLHTADLHLGAPIRGLGALTDEWAARLQTAIPEAYDRVIDVALSRNVDFVVMAGDMFDSSHASYCDYLRFFEGLKRLDEAGIPTYLVCGNHDPYTTWARDLPLLPKSAHMMGIGLPTFELFERDGEPLCLIGGRGYYAQAWPLDERISDGITRANAIGALTREHPRANEAPFTVGIIHTGLNLDASKAASDEKDLLAQDVDYWACGHLHRHMVRPIVDDPRVVFPGCIQGRDIKEAGERGCYLVQLEEDVSPRIEFVPTASVSLHSIDVDVSTCRTLSDVEHLVKAELFRESGYDYCSEMVARVNLVGETELHEFLRKGEVVPAMAKHVNDTCQGFFCDAVVDGTRPARSAAAIAQGNPLAQAVLDNAEAQRGREGELIDYVQAQLVQHGIAVPDALARRMGDFRRAAETLALDLVDERGDALDAAGAREELSRRVRARLSRDASGDDRSIYRLGEHIESAFVEVRKAGEDEAALKQAHRELRELEASRSDAVLRADELDTQLEDLMEWCVELKSLDADIAGLTTELNGVREESAQLKTASSEGPAIDPRLLELSVQDDRMLRDKIDECASEREKLQHAVDEAKARSDVSSAAYEAMVEVGEDGKPGSRGFGTKSVQIVVSALFPVVFVAAGVFLFVHGRQINSLSFSAFGAAMVVLAFFLAAAAIVVLFRPGKDAGEFKRRRQDAQWVMLQDKKLLAARIAEKSQADVALQELLAAHGLAGAEGSVRQALMLLDDARDERARIAETAQRALALQMHEESASATLTGLKDRRRQIEEDAGLEEGAPLRAAEALLREKKEQRNASRMVLDQSDMRREELERILDEAKADRRFDRLKQDYHQARARLRVAKHDYVTLLLAQRLFDGVS